MNQEPLGFNSGFQMKTGLVRDQNFKRLFSIKPGRSTAQSFDACDEFINRASFKTSPSCANYKNAQTNLNPFLMKQAAESRLVLPKSPLQDFCVIGNVASSLIKLIDLRDSYTGSHSRFVRNHSISLAKALGLSDYETELVSLGAAFHDIGKVGTPETILNKSSKLNEEEFNIIKKHPATGSVILENIPYFKDSICRIVKHHHESWDGSGYPDNLQGREIPLGARIVAVVDSFHAMTSNRPYRKGMSVTEAVRRLKNGSGSQWDPEITDKFIKKTFS